MNRPDGAFYSKPLGISLKGTVGLVLNVLDIIHSHTLCRGSVNKYVLHQPFFVCNCCNTPFRGQSQRTLS